MPRTDLALLRASFASRFGRASLDERKQFEAALAVCDAVARAMDERDKAILQPTLVTAWPQRAAAYREVINQLMQQEKAAEHPATSPSPH